MGTCLAVRPFICRDPGCEQKFFFGRVSGLTAGCGRKTPLLAGVVAGIASFANGLTVPWSSGPAEGRVNHIKMVKRQMPGRAGLPLLRKRVLPAAKN